MDDRESNISILIIPKIERIRQINLPSWVARSILAGLTVILLFVIAAFHWKINGRLDIGRDIKDREAQISELGERIDELKELNVEKDDLKLELQTKNDSLNKKMKQVEDKLEQIDGLKNRLKKLADARK
ncbi:MAG: hypothetical protein GX329_06160 [Tissierellia bacterium]|nr:hypothetical protein [Tissierellia bacterium]